MRKTVIELLLIIVLLVMCSIIELFNKELMILMYRGTTVYIASLILAGYINKMK